MKLRELRRTIWAVWLGMAALGLNALVPIHAAFDLAEATGKTGHGLEWRLFALASGHGEDAGKPDTHRTHHGHATVCAVCSAAAALAGFAGAAAIPLPAPYAGGAPATFAVAPDKPDGTFTAAYLSRAPPFG
jgi:hypothetical protein